MKAFSILRGIDALAALVILYFFFVGLSDGTVSSRNASLWIIILLLLTADMGGSVWLNSHGYRVAAILLLLLLALPALFFVLYMLIVLIGGGRMN